MPGRIRSEDIEAVRERARIDEVVADHVSLKSAGGGNLKGLCPFHDERSPSFQVTPSRGLYYCFGCGEGGDVLTFVQKVEHLTFAEAVEKLAGRYGLQLRYEQGSGPVRGGPDSTKARLVEANRAAGAYFVAQLATPAAAVGRQFLTDRGFGPDAVTPFGVGWAPAGWDNLGKALLTKGFSRQELQGAGLIALRNDGSTYDRFRGRLVWPIHDLSGDVIGFGARRMLEDDEGPKYLNTPETPLYRKSQVLYGIDVARKAIATTKSVVVVEGYTDVMAAHLAGVPTAVATCGTAFGTDHIRVLRRLLLDDGIWGGRVTFTFDGDEAGQRAALRAFGDDQRFVAQTYVAVQPDGLDPCDLRLAKGDAALVALVDSAIPLFEFAIRAQLRGVDLGSAEGRIAGLRAAAPVLAQIRDNALRQEYERQCAGWLALEPHIVTRAVAQARGSRGQPGAQSGAQPGGQSAPPPRPAARSTPADTAQRRAVQVALQAPQVAPAWVDALEPDMISSPRLAAVLSAIRAAGGAASGLADREWIDAVLAMAENDDIRTGIRALAVEPLPSERVDERYAVAAIARVLEATTAAQIAATKSALAQAAPSDAGYSERFAELLDLETYRRDLRVQVAGGPDA